MPEKSVYAQRLDAIQAGVYSYLKPLGFRKAGRAMQRIVDGDMVQTIQFQQGNTIREENDRFQVFTSMYIPEVEERTITPAPIKKTKSYFCNSFELKFDGQFQPEYPLYEGCEEHYIEMLTELLRRDILTPFDDLDTREKFLCNRRKYNAQTFHPGGMDRDAAYILARMGDMKTAAILLQAHYERGVGEDLEYAGLGFMDPNSVLGRKHYQEQSSERLGISLRIIPDESLPFPEDCRDRSARWRALSYDAQVSRILSIRKKWEAYTLILEPAEPGRYRIVELSPVPAVEMPR